MEVQQTSSDFQVSASDIQKLTKNDLKKALCDIQQKKNGTQCSACQYNFGVTNETKSPKSFKNPLVYLRRRKPVKCNRCHHIFCKSCCENLYYAEGFRDQKVPMCDNCYETEITIKSKKIRVAYKDSVFLADFAEKQVQKIYEEYYRKQIERKNQIENNVWIKKNQMGHQM